MWANGALTHCGLVTPYDDINLGQHWLRQWLVARRHQAITRTNVDLSLVRFCGIHLRAISQGGWPKLLFCVMSMKIIFLTFLPHLGCNELTHKNVTLMSQLWGVYCKHLWENCDVTRLNIIKIDSRWLHKILNHTNQLKQKPTKKCSKSKKYWAEIIHTESKCNNKQELCN